MAAHRAREAVTSARVRNTRSELKADPCDPPAGGSSSLVPSSLTPPSRLPLVLLLALALAVNFWADNNPVYFGSSGTVASSDAAVLKRETADPVRCAEACEADTSCRFAFLRYDSGACYLQGATDSRITTWVGNSITAEGGITFQKYLDPPPPSPPTPPPAAPPAPPPQEPSIPPGPTSPVGSCWHWFPSGCPSGNGAAASEYWQLDSWGPDNGYPGKVGCTDRVTGQNSWCGVTDILSHFIDYPPSPPPSPPTLHPSPPPHPPPSTILTQPCSDGNSICLLQDSTGCVSGCSAHEYLAEARYYGGSSCSSGGNICTVDYWKGHTKIYFTPSGTVSSDTSEVLKRDNAEPLRCAEACRDESSCGYAFFRFWSGECFLMTAGQSPANGMISTWVGSNSGSQGGVTFVKYVE